MDFYGHTIALRSCPIQHNQEKGGLYKITDSDADGALTRFDFLFHSLEGANMAHMEIIFRSWWILLHVWGEIITFCQKTFNSIQKPIWTKIQLFEH